jgi:hypothetical protein
MLHQRENPAKGLNSLTGFSTMRGDDQRGARLTARPRVTQEVGGLDLGIREALRHTQRRS